MDFYRQFVKLFLVFVPLFMACNRTEPILYRIPLEEGIRNASRLDWKDYVDSIRYVPLETNDSCLIADVYKIVSWENFYYVRDLQENLFLFAGDGKFIRKIGKQGKGPGEYTALADFMVDPLNGDIYLVTLGKIMVYSKEGKLLRTNDIGLNWQVAAFSGENHFVFVAPVPLDKQTPFLLVCDKNAEEICRIPGKEVVCDLGYFNWLQEQAGRVYYKEEFSDTLFYLDESFGPHPYACIDLGEFKFQPSHFTLEMMDEWPKYYRLNGMFDFKKSMVLNVQCGLMEQGQKLDSYLFDKESGKVGIFEENTAHDGFQIDGVVYRPRAVFQRCLLSTVSAMQLVEMRGTRAPGLQEVIRKTNENANPVLAILYMK